MIRNEEKLYRKAEELVDLFAKKGFREGVEVYKKITPQNLQEKLQNTRQTKELHSWLKLLRDAALEEHSTQNPHVVELWEGLSLLCRLLEQEREINSVLGRKPALTEEERLYKMSCVFAMQNELAVLERSTRKPPWEELYRQVVSYCVTHQRKFDFQKFYKEVASFTKSETFKLVAIKKAWNLQAYCNININPLAFSVLPLQETVKHREALLLVPDNLFGSREAHYTNIEDYSEELELKVLSNQQNLYTTMQLYRENTLNFKETFQLVQKLS